MTEFIKKSYLLLTTLIINCNTSITKNKPTDAFLPSFGFTQFKLLSYILLNVAVYLDISQHFGIISNLFLEMISLGED